MHVSDFHILCNVLLLLSCKNLCEFILTSSRKVKNTRKIDEPLEKQVYMEVLALIC